MYRRTYRKAEQERRFLIFPAGSLGWEVRDEHDRQIVRRVTYDDWHRVERARTAFAVEGARLKQSGWIEF